MKAAPAGEAEWRAAAATCPWATFFETPAWFAHAKALLPNHQVVVHALDVAGRSVVVPTLERRTRKAGVETLDRRGNAAGLYGGWLAHEPLAPAEARAVVDWFAKDAAKVRLRPNPFHPPFPLDGLGPQVVAEETSVLDLAQGTAALWRGYSHGQQENIERARNVGVKTRVASSPEDWQAHIRMRQDLQERWGESTTMRHGPEFIAGLAALPEGGCRLWLAELDGVPHAGVIVFYHGRHVALWHASSTEEQRRFYAYKLLLHRVLEDAAQRGFRWYDLMPSHDLKGTQAWKRFLGTQSLSAPMLVHPPEAARPA